MTPDAAIRRYADAFAARDADAVVALFAPLGLYEMPLLRSRMVGHAEIREGLERAFALVTSCAIGLRSVRSLGSLGLAEGDMLGTLAREPSAFRIPFALAARVEATRLVRLSIYLDARPFRLWSDGPVLALPP